MNDAKIMQTNETVADRADEFVPAPINQESASAVGLLTTAYILMWVAVFVFVFLSSRRLKYLSSKMNELEAQLRAVDDHSRAKSASGDDR
jgi:hypothetical protein